jgi:uncharacterized protein (DUF488 family)
MKPKTMNPAGIVTIGYEGRSLDQFISLLVENHVGKLSDIRANAFSRKKGFSKNPLIQALGDHGIAYLHLPELGIGSARRKNLTQEGASELLKEYARELPAKEELLDTIRKLSSGEKVALMCFEAHEADCHRGVIARQFREEGIDVVTL